MGARVLISVHCRVLWCAGGAVMVRCASKPVDQKPSETKRATIARSLLLAIIAGINMHSLASTC